LALFGEFVLTGLTGLLQTGLQDQHEVLAQEYNPSAFLGKLGLFGEFLE
jgi:hypothetical protein